MSERQFEVGDVVYRTHNGQVAERHQIERVTPKFAFITLGRSEAKYDRATGQRSPRPTGFSTERIQLPTSRLDEEYRRARRRLAARRLSEAAMEAAREVEGHERKVSEAYAAWLDLA